MDRRPAADSSRVQTDRFVDVLEFGLAGILPCQKHCPEEERLESGSEGLQGALVANFFQQVDGFGAFFFEGVLGVVFW